MEKDTAFETPGPVFRRARRADAPEENDAGEPPAMGGRFAMLTGQAPQPGQGAAPHWRRPSTLTAIAPLRPEAVKALRDRLTEMGRAVEDLPNFPVTALTTTHFFRLLVTDDHAEPRPELPPHLLLGTVYDGTLDEHLRDLTTVLGPALTEIFANCAGFAAGTDLAQFITRHVVPHKLLHIGAVRVSLRDIRQEAEMVAALQTFVDERMKAGAWRDATLSAVRQSCLRFVQSRPDLPQGARPRRPLLSRLLQAGALLRQVLLFLVPAAVISWALPWARQSLLHWAAAGLLVLLIVFVTGLLVIRFLELTEPDDVPKEQPDTADVEAQEDFQVQNQFTMLTPIRASWARRFAIGVMLWFGNHLSEHLWNRGKLVGVGTIHFARMLRPFGGRYMLFMSDYDGSWRRYLGDFLTVGAFAVVPIWAHLKGCPKTRFLYFTTPGFGERFLRFTRTNQVPSHFWYSAYKDFTMYDIMRAGRIREGLFSARTDQEIQKWLWEL
jgi:hypothetical protein